MIVSQWRHCDSPMFFTGGMYVPEGRLLCVWNMSLINESPSTEAVSGALDILKRSPVPQAPSARVMQDTQSNKDTAQGA